MNQNNFHKYEGFKLISLDLRSNHLYGGNDIFYSFIDADDIKSSIYTTVVIGPNGTGKSNLFRIIIELFKELYDLSRNENRSYNISGLFNLKFSSNGDIFEYSNFSNDEEFFEDIPNPERGVKPFLMKNRKITGFENAPLPLSIVANSIMLTDKFPFYRRKKNFKGEKVDAFPLYKYLGVRNIPQSASTRAYVRRTVEFIVQQFGKKGSNKSGFISALKRATDFLDLSNSIDIFYYTQNTAKFFRGNLTPDTLADYFESIKIKYPNPEDNPPFKLNQYKQIEKDKKIINEICDFCNKLVNEGKLEKLPYKYSSKRKIIYNLIEPILFERLNSEFYLLEYLRKLGMISSPEIQLKRENGYSLQESSSGEYHFFSSIVGLLATVNPTNSLILIDEPEISLHPNWQMEYLTFLRELFNHPEYKTCHIIVATHSHFLISDLKGNSSKIIGLKRINGKVETIEFPKNIDTFGWSAEDVLYNIFNVASSRNKFVATDIAEILNELSKGKKGNKNILSKEKYEEIIELESALKENDPLKKVVKLILSKISY